MPICVHCNSLAEHVYTVYSSRDNIRLAVCNQCGLFVDPLIEHPPVLLLIDLILLKPRVYRHLVFNYGSEPLQAGRKPATTGKHNALDVNAADGVRLGKESSEVEEKTRVATANHNRSKITLRSILWMSVVTMSVESVVLYSTIRGPSTESRDIGDLAIFSHAERRKWLWSIVVVILSTSAQHLATTAIAAGFLKLRYPIWLLSGKEKLAVIVGENGHKTVVRTLERRDRSVSSSVDARSGDGRGLYFVLQMVPLTLFFTSLLPCILHICLFIWSSHTVADPNAVSENVHQSGTSHILPLLEEAVIPHLTRVVNLLPSNVVTELDLFWEAFTSAMKREGIDEMWIAVRLLAGMSSGFGLRVILPNPPWQTSVAVLGGWLAKTVIQTVLYAYLF